MDAGLCGTCLHSRRIVSDRGSVFSLCQLSFGNPRFRKYPPLPVIECSGYASGDPTAVKPTAVKPTKEALEPEDGPCEG